MNRLHHLDPHLVRAFIHDIITVAQRGWMPLDLQHVFGPAVASVLEKAAPQIPARIGIGKIRHAWLSYRPSDYDLSLATTLKQIGRASCRESVQRWGGGGSMQRTNPTPSGGRGA